MTVAELIEKLQQENPKRIVVMAKDAEGNGHSPLHDFWAGAYRAETTWYGDVGLETLSADDEERGYTEGDIVEGEPALILMPVN